MGRLKQQNIQFPCIKKNRISVISFPRKQIHFPSWFSFLVSLCFLWASLCYLLVSLCFLWASLCYLLVSLCFLWASLCYLLVSLCFLWASLCYLLVSLCFLWASLCYFLVSLWFLLVSLWYLLFSFWFLLVSIFRFHFETIICFLFKWRISIFQRISRRIILYRVKGCAECFGVMAIKIFSDDIQNDVV